MKKHENAIKALMKNVKDNAKWYGYFEDENGARYLMNTHIVIKLTGSTLDYVGELPRLDNIKLVKQFIDFIGTFKKGEYSTNVNVNDVKIFDKYKELGECFKQQYADNKYIAFNPFYFCKLNILTGSDLLTITDNRSPIYIAGNDIECILLPCSLDKNYNSDNYAVFLEELKACYIQDEADKTSRKEKREAKKNAETMTEIKEGETINGFYAYLSGREYFLKTDNKRVTKKVVEHFIKAVGIVKGKNADTIEKMTTLKENVDYTKGRISNATLKKNTIGNYTFIDIDGDNFSYGGNIDELKGKLYIFDFDALTPITFYQDEEKTTAADVMSATTTDTVATTDTATNDRKKVLHGFYMTFKNRDIFVVTNEETKRRYIVQSFINEMINISNHLKNITEEKRNNILNDEDVLKETKKRIIPATIEEIWTRQENHIRITSDNNNMIVNHSLNNFKTIIIDCYSANEGGTPVQEKSLKFFSGISRINNQLTETITQDIKADLQADNRHTETTQDITPTQDTPQKKSISLFIVTDKPAPVKLPNLKPLNNIPMFQERFKTDFKQRNNARVYNNRVSNKKVLKKAYNNFMGTVSCYSDKCAIGGKVAAGNTS